MRHVLLVEDDNRISTELIENLEKNGFLVTHLKTVAQTALIEFERFDCLILDWNLPDGDGLEITSQVRSKQIDVPILMLTANTDLIHRKKALEAGVNDFLGKPFYMHELLARIEVLMDSSTRVLGKSSDWMSGDIKINKAEMRAFYKTIELVLTKKEFDLLVFFVSQPGTVFSRNEILDAVWGEDINLTPRTVDTHVLNLRKKLSAELFQTVWSSGYRYIESPGSKS